MVALRSRLGINANTAPPTGVRRDAAAGALSALLMIAVQLGWRILSDTGAPAFPEQVVAAVARLTPLDVFGDVTETYGSTAKRVLFVAVLFGIVAVGALAGIAATRLSRQLVGNGLAKGTARSFAGLVVALALLLFTALVVEPIGHYGVFARDSQYAFDIQIQLLITFAIWWVVWSLLGESIEPSPSTARGDGGVSRRRLAQAPLAILGLAASGFFTWRILGPESAATVASRRAADEIARRAQGIPPDSAVAGAARLATPSAGDAAAVLQGLESEGHVTPLITSIADFYSVSKNIIDPSVSADGWALQINGLVYNELSLTLDELRAMATTSQISTLCCISNELNGDLISTAEWQGVPLVQLLAQVGARPEVVDLRILAADDYEDSIPLSAALASETLVVVGMNGEPLPEKNGFPARLIVPGIYGMKNVKWLQEITLIDEDFQGYWQTRGWSDPAPTQIWARVDWPQNGAVVTGADLTIAGVASAVKRGISRVEVSFDDGATWADADLEPSLNGGLTWRRWVITPELEPGEYVVRVRATDGDGVVAPQEERPPLPDGATGWPKRRFTVA